MFHQANNLFFGRTKDGDVRILKLNEPPQEWPKMGYSFPENTILDVTIPADHWASIVASVSSGGEENGRWYNAIDFHKGKL